MKKKRKHGQVIFPIGIECSFLRDAIGDFLKELREYEIPKLDMVGTPGHSGFKIYVDGLDESDIKSLREAGDFSESDAGHPVVYGSLKKIIRERMDRWVKERDSYLEDPETKGSVKKMDKQLGCFTDAEVWEFTLTKKYKYSQLSKKSEKAAHSRL